MSEIERLRAEVAELRDIIERQFATMERVASVGLQLPVLLIEAFQRRDIFAPGGEALIEGELQRIAMECREEPFMGNAIVNILRELRERPARMN